MLQLRAQVQTLTQLLNLNKHTNKLDRQAKVDAYRRKLYQVMLSQKLTSHQHLKIINELSEKQIKAETALISMSEQLRDEKSRAQTLKKQYSNLNEKYTQTQRQHQSLQGDLKRQDDERQELLEQINEVEIEARSASVLNMQKISDLETHIEQVESENKKLRQQVSILKSGNMEQLKIRTELEQNLSKATNQLSRIADSLQNQQSKSGSLSEQIAVYKMKQEKTEQELGRMSIRLQAAERANMTNEQQMRNLRTNVDERQQALVRKQQEVSTLREDSTKQQQRVENYEKQIKVLTNRLAQTKQKHEESESEFTTLQNKIDQLSKSLKTANRTISELKRNNEDHQQDIEQKNNTINTLEKQVKQLKKSIETLNQQASELKNTIESTSNDSTQKASTIQTMRVKIQQLQILNKALKDETYESTQTFVQMKERHKQEVALILIQREKMYQQNGKLVQLLDAKQKSFLKILNDQGINIGQSNTAFGMANTVPTNLNLFGVSRRTRQQQ